MTVGSPPVVRLRGTLQRFDGVPPLSAGRDARPALPHPLDASSRSASRSTASSTSPTRSRASPASASTSSSSARRSRAAFRLIPNEIKSLEELGLPVGAAPAREEAARPRPRHRPDRLRQVDDARLDDRRDQPHAAPTTSSRSRIRSSSCTVTRAASSTSARSASTRRRSPRRCAARCARTPT